MRSRLERMRRKIAEIDDYLDAMRYDITPEERSYWRRQLAALQAKVVGSSENMKWVHGYVDEWPHPERASRRDESGRRWRVEYDLAYDGGGEEFTRWYHTEFGARVSIWWNRNISSWGGSAILIDQEKTR